MNNQKDWGLAMRTVAALISYRTSRAVDVLLIALVPVRNVLHFDRSRRPTRWTPLSVIAIVGAWMTDRSSKGGVSGV
jgi:hypothetical protein